jgi:hypothetical protein
MKISKPSEGQFHLLTAGSRWRLKAGAGTPAPRQMTRLPEGSFFGVFNVRVTRDTTIVFIGLFARALIALSQQ